MLPAFLAVSVATLIAWPFQTVNRTDEVQYRIGTGGMLKVETANGNIAVQTWDGHTVKVTVLKRAQTESVLADLHVNASAANGNVTLKAVYPRTCMDCEISFEIAVPHGTSVEATTASGAINATNVSGKLSLEDLSGDISVFHASGSIVARSASGDIRVEGAEGPIVCKTASGRIEITGLLGDLNARAASGNVSARFADLAAVRSIELKAASGNVSLAMPRSTGATIDASTIAGSIASDFGAPRQGYAGALLLQTIGDGRVKVQLSVASGDITLRAI